MKHLQAKTAAELEAWLLALLARAWTPSLPALLSGNLSLRDPDSLVPTYSALWAIVRHSRTNSFDRHPDNSIRLTISHRARVAGKLVPQNPTDKPAGVLPVSVTKR